MTESTTQTLSEKLAARYAGMKYDDIPAANRKAVKRLLMDWLGVAVGGSQSESGRIARAFAREQEGKAQAQIAGDNDRVPMANAATRSVSRR